MRKEVVVIGVGEIGGVFARGLLKAGHPVVPVIRDVNWNEIFAKVPDPEAVVVAVGEADLDDVLTRLPREFDSKLVLVQNELLPRNWETHNIDNPTVISVWFEKKPGQDVKVLISSPVYGPKEGLIKSALDAINIPCHIVKNDQELLTELVIKNLYILTVNICGLDLNGGTVSQLWNNHFGLARNVVNDILDVQFKLIGQEFDREQLIAGMVKAFDGDPDHKCLGRTAAARLARAIQQADEFGLEVKTLRKIKAAQEA